MLWQSAFIRVDLWPRGRAEDAVAVEAHADAPISNLGIECDLALAAVVADEHEAIACLMRGQQRLLVFPRQQIPLPAGRTRERILVGKDRPLNM